MMKCSYREAQHLILMMKVKEWQENDLLQKKMEKIRTSSQFLLDTSSTLDENTNMHTFLFFMNKLTLS